MEIKEISYLDRLPKNMVSKFNYFDVKLDSE